MYSVPTGLHEMWNIGGVKQIVFNAIGFLKKKLSKLNIYKLGGVPCYSKCISMDNTMHFLGLRLT